MYAWSRQSHQIKFVEDFDKELLRLCQILMDEYGSATEIPLIGNDVREKLLRLSVAHACFRHSTDDSGENVIVRVDDVNAVAKLMTEIYSADSFGLGQYADTQKTESRLCEEEYQSIKLELIGDNYSYCTTQVKRKLVRLFAQASEITGSELSNQIDLDRKIIGANISSFKKFGLITAKRGSGYKTTTKFNQFTRRLQIDGIRLQSLDQ